MFYFGRAVLLVGACFIPLSIVCSFLGAFSPWFRLVASLCGPLTIPFLLTGIGFVLGWRRGEAFAPATAENLEH